MAALDSAAEVLEDGHLFGIYPEGTRSPDGRLYKGKTGVARLALRCQVPVLAVAMIGTKEIQPIGQVKPNIFRPITVRISPPMDFSKYYDRPTDPKVLREITDEIMFELRGLSGQEYVHTYAKRKSEDEVMQPETTPIIAGPPLEPLSA
jgi:1-acyl-sn-glycerol-3-phosphate acyltransferase